ncbi:hypothetical protein [Gordonia hankookensis]|uniref:Lipoprotein LpqN n=1 Tax=Gordonia hankookensis TaxID=589403 RepID=A0ABR7WD52_9ACTN|nr:hypothetical protein [Gordonia hankookensis]MBD1319772.1 hypothetical protein [Gordonia hankookensis]NDZ95122.1 hypothetical protein [Streptomyces sp. SID11726]NEB24076.1 hypothetical protein [Streptomyces sp. SID6673]
MNLVDVLQNTPGVTLDALSDPLELGYRPVGLPVPWRRVRAGLVAGQPGVTWLDSSAFASVDETGVDGEEFVSSAILIGWIVGGMSTSPARLASLVADVTHEAPGWSTRSQYAESLSGQGFSFRLLGTLTSPFGGLVSNTHDVVCPIGDGQLAVLQLAVTATQDWSAIADDIMLEARSGSD